MINIAEKEAVFRLVNDQTNVAAHPGLPKVLVLRSVDPMKGHSRIDRIQLKVECRCLGDLLLIASKSSEAIGESICDEEFHHRGGQSPSFVSRRSITSLDTANLAAIGFAKYPM